MDQTCPGCGARLPSTIDSVTETVKKCPLCGFDLPLPAGEALPAGDDASLVDAESADDDGLDLLAELELEDLGLEDAVQGEPKQGEPEPEDLVRADLGPEDLTPEVSEREEVESEEVDPEKLELEELEPEELELEEVEPEELPSPDESPGVPSDNQETESGGKVESTEETELEWLTDELPSDDTDLDAEDTLLDSAPAPGEVDPFEMEVIAEETEDAELETVAKAEDDATAAAEDGEGIFAFEQIEDEDATPAALVEDEPSGPTPDTARELEEQAVSMTAAPLVPKKKNLLATVAKLGVGALVVSVLAQALAWYGLGVDPLGLAYLIPALAPPSLRPTASANWNRPTPNTGPSEFTTRSGTAADPQREDESQQDGESSVDDAASVVDDFQAVEPKATPPTSQPDEVADAESLSDPATDSGAVANNSDFFVEGLDEDDGGMEETTAVPPNESLGQLLESSKPAGTDIGSDPQEELMPAEPFSVEEESGLASDGLDAVGNDVATTAEPTDLDELLGGMSDAADESGLGADDLFADQFEDVPAEQAPDAGEHLFDDNRPIGAPSYTRNDVAATISSTRKAQQAFEEARLLESADIKQIAIDFYVSFCNLAERATLVSESGSEAVRAEARRTMMEYATDESKQRFIANCARGWLQPKPGTTVVPERGPGVFLVGSVDLIQTTGSLFEMKVRLNESRQTQVVVVTRLDPSANPITSISQGSNVLVMGTTVDDPSANLPGYTGNSTSVIYVTDQISLAP